MDEPKFLLGYWIAHVQRVLHGAFVEFLRVWCQEYTLPFVLTPSQWAVLWLLLETDGIPIGTISQRRAIDAPSITDVVARLERHGLLRRVHDDADRRLVRVFLTDAGRAIAVDLLAATIAFNGRLERTITPREMRVTHSVIGKLLATAQELTPTKTFATITLPALDGQALHNERST
jgi:DNA-binding MarR family transcriptional regulator